MDDVAELMDKHSHSHRFRRTPARPDGPRAVLALPAKYRDAMILYYFHEMDVPAASKSLGVPEGTVKAQAVSRARNSAQQAAATAGSVEAEGGMMPEGNGMEDELDRMLSTRDEIVPSSGFVMSVMDAVRHEAAVSEPTPLPPIAFPWLRALPIFAALAAVLVMLIGGIVAAVRTPAASHEWASGASRSVACAGASKRWLARRSPASCAFVHASVASLCYRKTLALQRCHPERSVAKSKDPRFASGSTKSVPILTNSDH